MKVFEKVQIDISELTCAAEMVGYLDALKLRAVIYCYKNHPEEIIKPNDISIIGLSRYLDSEIENH